MAEKDWEVRPPPPLAFNNDFAAKKWFVFCFLPFYNHIQALEEHWEDGDAIQELESEDKIKVEFYELSKVVAS